MAFNRDYLQCVGPAGNSPRTWTYKTQDTHATVDAAGYFNDAGDVLSLCDLIDVVVVTNLGASNEAVSTYGRHIVNAKSGPTAGAYTIDVTNVTAGSVIDSD